jgi:hypothetical protein
LYMTNWLIMKKFALISINELTSIYIIQTITQLWIWLVWIKNINKIKNLKEVKYNKYIYVILIFFGVITEFYMCKYLSLYLMSTLYNIRFIIFLWFDYVNWQLKINKKMILWVLIWIIWIWIFALF